MFKNQNAVCSPYGAYELKATYQRNMLASCLSVNGLIAIASLLVVVFVNSQGIKDVPPGQIRIIKEIQPPSIVIVPRQVDVIPPITQPPAEEQVIPLDDDNLVDDSTEIVSIDHYVEKSAFEEGQPTGENIGPVTFEDDGTMPGIDQFVPVEQIPEFVYKAQPEYPRFERMAGVEGTVWIAVEVDIDGSVANARVYKSSGRNSFDQAALDVAFDNIFRPAIQNNNPIKLWVAYEVEFVLNE